MKLMKKEIKSKEFDLENDHEVVFRIESEIGILGINRPKALNALNTNVAKSLKEILLEIKEEKSLKGLIIYGDKHFAAGADISEMVDLDKEAAWNFSLSPIFEILENLQIPTFAAISGYGLGGGLEMALACDLRFMATEAKVGFPEINLGIMPGAGGNVRALRLLGSGKAKELIYTGRILDSKEAYDIGLVNGIFPSENLLEETLKIMKNIIKNSHIALRAIKNTMSYATIEQDNKKAIDFERDQWSALFQTDGQKEAMAQFLRKEKNK